MAQTTGQYSSRYPTNTYYTKGGEFTVRDTGQEYRGPYHVVDGLARTGKPKNPEAQILMPVIYDRYSTYIYDKLQNFKNPARLHRQPKYFRPQPIRSEYAVGHFYRYVVTHTLRPEKFPIEIDVGQANSYGSPKGIDKGLYTLHKIKWTITGALEDLDTKGGKILSVENANKAAVYAVASKYPVILYAFRNYTEFADFTFF